MAINDNGNYKITGVIKNNPAQSHFNFDSFIPIIENSESNDHNWLSQNWDTYIFLKKDANAKQLEPLLNGMMDKLFKRSFHLV